MTKQFTPKEMLGDALLAKLIKLANGVAPGTNLHKEILDKIVTPHMTTINARTGQENDPRYIAYALEFALQQTRRQTRG